MTSLMEQSTSLYVPDVTRRVLLSFFHTNARPATPPPAKHRQSDPAVALRTTDKRARGNVTSRDTTTITTTLTKNHHTLSHTTVLHPRHKILPNIIVVIVNSSLTLTNVYFSSIKKKRIKKNNERILNEGEGWLKRKRRLILLLDIAANPRYVTHSITRDRLLFERQKCRTLHKKK